MEQIKELVFKKITGEVIENVEKYVKDWVKENQYGKVIVGCDSQVHGRRIKYSIIVVMHKIDRMEVGHGCHLLVCDIWEKRMLKSQVDEMPSKLWKEAEYALQAAELVNGKDEYFKKSIEVHLDFNSVPAANSHENLSNRLYAAGLGLLSGYGYVVYGKPFAKIASNVADHFCR